MSIKLYDNYNGSVDAIFYINDNNKIKEYGIEFEDSKIIIFIILENKRHKLYRGYWSHNGYYILNERFSLFEKKWSLLKNYFASGYKESYIFKIIKKN